MQIHAAPLPSHTQKLSHAVSTRSTDYVWFKSAFDCVSFLSTELASAEYELQNLKLDHCLVHMCPGRHRQTGSATHKQFLSIREKLADRLSGGVSD